MNLVTGATGTVGRHVVERLLTAGADVRATSRRPSTAHLPDRVEVVRAVDGTVPLAGVSTVFLNVTAIGGFTDSAEASDRLKTLLGRARSHGVRRIVLLSSAAVLDDANPVGTHHRELERQVTHSRLEWTLLRPGAFNSNTLAWAKDIRARGVVRAPFANARIAPIDERDIGAVAARALLCDSGDALVGSAPVLSGPEVLTPADQVRIISQTIGVPLRFDEVPPEDMHRDLIEAGTPLWAAEGLLRYYAQAVTHPVEISSAVAQITGQQPRTFAIWAADHATAFRAAV